MSSNIASPLPVELARKFRPHEKPDELRFDFAGHPFTADLLNSDKTLVLEIGCGVGWHPIQMAQQLVGQNSAMNTANTLIIAIERTKNKFDSFRQRLQNHPELQSSLCAVHGDAYHFVDRNFPVARLDEVWMLYPNPETKRPDRRWYRAPSFQRIVEAMKPGALFHFATNLPDFAEGSLRSADTFGLEVVSQSEFTKKSHPFFQSRSHFEKKYFERGEVLYAQQFQKKHQHDNTENRRT